MAARRTILVVDDEAVVRRAVRQILELAGYAIVEAECGLVALEMVIGRESPIDLVLTDCEMRSMDGWELVRALGVLRPELPTIIMTGWVVALEQLPAKPTAVLEKPFTAATLTESVRSVLAEQ